jgi:putative ABC transport system permease protein
MVQILSESMVMTTAAGLLGLCFAVLILAAVEAITEMNGTPAAFQISFNEAVSITFTFIVLGTAAGLLPAWRTMKIKPIEALQDD